MRSQSGQSIVIVGLMIVVLFGFVGLAMDGGRGYLDRRSMQAGVDAAALAAAYDYMNNNDYTRAETVAANIYAENQRLYSSPLCTTSGAPPAMNCPFGDPTGQVLTVTAANHSIAGVTFTATATHSIPVTMMQVLGVGSTMSVGATATSLARKTGTNGAAIQTLSPGGCGGSAGNSLTFQGNSTTLVTGDIWSNGDVFDNSAAAGGQVNGNVVAVCGTTPFLKTPNPPNPWSVSGDQVDGWTMPDPGYSMPSINAGSTPVWNRTNGATQVPGVYTADPNLPGSAGCSFLAGGVYDFSAGFSDNGGFVSNELRPPDEPYITISSAAVSGTVTSIPVPALSVAIPASSTILLSGQAFTVTSAGAAAGATSIPVTSTFVTGTIGSGATVITNARSNNQFWDANKGSCSSTFSLSSPGSGGGISAGVYSVELTAVRWESTTSISGCSPGPSSSTCYERESAPSMCRTVTVGPGGNLKVAVSPADPGAMDYNVYVASNGSCTGLTFCRNLGNGTISSCLGGSAPPDPERPPLASILPNTDPPAGNPPHGDLANESHCVDPVRGSSTACPGGWTPGAIVLVIPGGTPAPCLVLHGKGDIYLFSGYQYSRVVLFEPGPEQSSVPNTCTGNIVNGNGFTSMIGIFYMPAASLTINGNSAYRATIAGGVIAWTASVIGSGNVAITADPTLRAWPSTVRLTQ